MPLCERFVITTSAEDVRLSTVLHLEFLLALVHHLYGCFEVCDAVLRFLKLGGYFPPVLVGILNVQAL